MITDKQKRNVKRIIEGICKKMGWNYWYDNEGKLIIDVDDSLSIAE